jgi:hypothetical protein
MNYVEQFDEVQKYVRHSQPLLRNEINSIEETLRNAYTHPCELVQFDIEYYVVSNID